MAKDAEPLDLIWGAEEMAKLIGRTPPQVYHMLNAGHLPAKQIGDRWVISRQKLVSVFLEDAS